ncbi:MAG TPA: hypothetical protein VN017_08410 [Pseudoxanthomonas sp.]|nr:hypothetical protein [Pseudoxanthomonas sp.]
MHFSSKPFRCVLALSVVGLLSGCVMEPGRYTGGGTINSLGGAGRAQISFNADGCDPKNVKGNVHYNDNTAIEYQDIGGVKFKATVTTAGLCTTQAASTAAQILRGDYGNVPGCNTAYQPLRTRNPLDEQCSPGQIAIMFDYASSNPKAPGNGTGLFCAAAAGAGAGGNLHGYILPVILKTGPYAGYRNGGSLVGNVMPHSCDATESG